MAGANKSAKVGPEPEPPAKYVCEGAAPPAAARREFALEQDSDDLVALLLHPAWVGRARLSFLWGFLASLRKAGYRFFGLTDHYEGVLKSKGPGPS